LNLLLAIVAKPKDDNIIDVFVISFKDFIGALKVKKYAITFAVLVLAAAGVLTYTTISGILTPQIKSETERPASEYNVTGNELGDPDATLVVHEYTDYKCPFCFVLNTMLYRAVSELSNIRVVHHNLPLDNTCNLNLGKQQMHEGSCMLAKYSISAGYQGKFWDMNTALFEKEFNSEEDILKTAKKLGLDVEKLKADADSKKVVDELQKEIEEATKLKIEGTPALRINMDVNLGSMPYEELKEKLIKAGAKEKK
jgi:predicted DsbA family dithiol-disulfide isomerase